jgi:choline dehydrogenase-like flavoprotein
LTPDPFYAHRMRARHGFSPAERRIFRAVVGAVVGHPVSADVGGAVQPFVSRLPATDRRLLSILLRIVEYAVPVLTGRLRRFSSLALADQQRYLRGWEQSRVALRRQGAASLRALASVAYYGRASGWAAVGYDGPWLGRVHVPVLPAPDLRAGSSTRLKPGPTDEVDPVAKPESGPTDGVLGSGVTLGRSIQADIRLRVQVCVIGTGAGGAAAMARLAANGLDVIGLEAGGYVTAADCTQRELDMLPLLFQDAALRATADKSIGILQGRGVGGSTLHNTGLVYGPPPAVLERWRREHGLAIGEQQAEEYVAAVLRTLRATPIPVSEINPNNAVLQRGAEALGWRYRVPLHNRAECCGCGYCIIGCAYNRKYNAALTWLPQAVADGARILADAPVLRIDGRPGARRVICQLRHEDGRPTGRRATIEASIVMVAAGALDTPALLQRSGLGNRHVGRGLRLHPSALVGGVFPEPIRGWRGLPQSVVVEEFAGFREGHRGGFLVIALAGPPGLGAMLVPHIGAAHRAVMDDYPHLASAVVLLHDEGAGSVTVSRDGRPVVRYWPDEHDRRGLLDGIRALGGLYFAAGARRVWLPFPGSPPVQTEAELDHAMGRVDPLPHRLLLNSVHPQGSCPLGSVRDRSACDPMGELWGEPGVFVCDASLFPTSVGVPPQVTVMALATAVADHVVERVRF